MAMFPLNEDLEIDIESNIVEFPRRSATLCVHANVVLDAKANELICKKCQAKVNPVMWIRDHVEYIARLQREVREEKERIKADREELQRRSRTRCQHCKKMTAINLKYHNFQIMDGRQYQAPKTGQQ